MSLALMVAVTSPRLASILSEASPIRTISLTCCFTNADEGREVAGLIASSHDDDQRTVFGLQSIEDGIDVGGFGVVDERHAFDVGDRFKTMRNRSEGLQSSGDGFDIDAQRQHHGRGGGGVGKIVRAFDSQLTRRADRP